MALCAHGELGVAQLSTLPAKFSVKVPLPLWRVFHMTAVLRPAVPPVQRVELPQEYNPSLRKKAVLEAV